MPSRPVATPEYPAWPQVGVEQVTHGKPGEAAHEWTVSAQVAPE
jgi:hypothetical protein